MFLGKGHFASRSALKQVPVERPAETHPSTNIQSSGAGSWQIKPIWTFFTGGTLTYNTPTWHVFYDNQ